VAEIYGKVLGGKAVIVDGEMEIAPGVKDVGLERPRNGKPPDHHVPCCVIDGHAILTRLGRILRVLLAIVRVGLVRGSQTRALAPRGGDSLRSHFGAKAKGGS